MLTRTERPRKKELGYEILQYKAVTGNIIIDNLTKKRGLSDFFLEFIVLQRKLQHKLWIKQREVMRKKSRYALLQTKGASGRLGIR